MGSPVSWLSPAAMQALGWALIHFVWQGVAIAALAAALMGFCRRPSARYWVGVGALALMLAMPVVSFLRFDDSVLNLPAWAAFPRAMFAGFAPFTRSVLALAGGMLAYRRCAVRPALRRRCSAAGAKATRAIARARRCGAGPVPRGAAAAGPHPHRPLSGMRLGQGAGGNRLHPSGGAVAGCRSHRAHRGAIARGDRARTGACAALGSAGEPVPGPAAETLLFYHPALCGG